MNRSSAAIMSLLLATTAHLATTAQYALAQTKSSPTGALEEIIVTANRREQNLQEVAISVAAFTEQFFRDTGTANLQQLEQYTPSLKIAPVQDSRSTSIRIRGIGSIGSNAGIDPSVGLFIDGIYQGRAGMSIADFIDIQRVEVLRGPQGTLYGKNTAAGALNIISKPPSEVFEAELQSVVGNYDALEFRGMVNLPLGDSGNAVRVSAYNVDREGFDDNKTLNEDMNNADRWGTKARALFTLGDFGEVVVTADYAEENSDCCAPDIIDYEGDGFPLGIPFSLLSESTGMPLPEADPFDRDLYFDQPWTNEVSVGGLAAEWNGELANETGLTWLNAWRTYDNDSRFDGDFSPFAVVSGAAKVNLDQYSSEFRITSPEGETFDYVAGLYYFYSKMDTEGETGMLPLAGQLFGGGAIFPDGSVNFDNNTHETTSFAAFGQMNWNISEKWRATLGARLTHEEKNRDGLQVTVPDTVIDAPPIAGPDLASDDTRSEQDISPSVSVSYFIREDLMAYASISQGFKSGGFNQLRTAAAVSAEFDDERSRNYELGWKGSWLDRRLQINGTVFFVEYDDFQAQGFDGANITVRNAGSLESKGVELDVIYVASANLTLGGALGYNEAEYSDFETGECTIAQLFAVTGGSPFVAPDCVQDLSGEVLDNAPEWTVSTYVHYENIVNASIGWFARVEYNYTDEFYMAQDLDENLLNDETHLVNARVGIFGEDRRWEITAWGRNLLDEEYYIIGFDVPILSGFTAINAPPLTYGLTLNYRWD
ncbi:MAG: iron complex outermembrane receptor protein [Bacteroidia bacterium]|jgi:iron complex outermembrane receptor protein